MKKIVLFAFSIWSFSALAIPCQCEVQVSPPTTASKQIGTNKIKIYNLDEFSDYSFKSQRECRRDCIEEFLSDMPATRLKALLITYSQALISENAVGFNCTGLTTLKYPVRVKVTLGQIGLGNVVDQLEVVSHEEACF